MRAPPTLSALSHAQPVLYHSETPPSDDEEPPEVALVEGDGDREEVEVEDATTVPVATELLPPVEVPEEEPLDAAVPVLAAVAVACCCVDCVATGAWLVCVNDPRPPLPPVDVDALNVYKLSNQLPPHVSPAAPEHCAVHPLEAWPPSPVSWEPHQHCDDHSVPANGYPMPPQIVVQIRAFMRSEEKAKSPKSRTLPLDSSTQPCDVQPEGSDDDARRESCSSSRADSGKSIDAGARFPSCRRDDDATRASSWPPPRAILRR